MPSLSTIRSTDKSSYIPLISPTIVCVGGTAGIGEHIARKLVSLSQNPEVHIIGRSETAANTIIKELQQQNPSGQYRFYQCDLTLLSATKKLISHLSGLLGKIDVLVTSQGIFTTKGRTETPEGNDVKMMLHYYSRMAVIDGLRSKFRDGTRVMSVLDGTGGNVKGLKWNDLDLKHNYSVGNAAKHCITMTDLALQRFGQQHPSTTFYNAYPGIVDTPIFRNLSPVARVAIAPLKWAVAVSPSDCAEYLVHALLNKDTQQYEVGGAAFVNNKGDPVKRKATSTEEQRNNVWEHTESILRGSA